jgi:hypothetical protein
MRLLHIGPPDTGTEAIRRALRDGRPTLAAAGVRYAGPFDADSGESEKSGWARLSSALRHADGDQALVASCEGLAAAPQQTIRGFVRAAGPGVRVVATLRPLALVLPAYWQTLLQSGETTAFDDWLRTVLDTPVAGAAAAFWAVHRHDALVKRWTEALGPDAVSVVVVPGGGDGRDIALRAFERLLGLPSGGLRDVPDPADRDLTLAEAEAVRALNTQCAEDGFTRAQIVGLIRDGASVYLRRRMPAPDEAPIELPASVLTAVETAARAIVHGIAASGVRVIGDPDALAVVPTSRAGENDPVTTPQVVAATLSMGVLIASGAARAPGRRRVPEPAGLLSIPAGRVAAIVVTRAGRSLLARVRRIARPLLGIAQTDA